MRIGEAGSAEGGRVGSMRDGVLEQKFLLTGEDESPTNYVINVGRTGAGGWTTPRHRHDFDQIRYVLKGSYPVSPHKVMKEGSVAYFPESVHYGPQDRPDGLEMMVIQLGGASGNGFLSVKRREAANEELKSKGEFKNGIFTWIDAEGKKHNQDGSAACFEHATGKKLEFAKPRYDDVVMLDPEAYAWMDTDMPGVQKRFLGTFTERGTAMSFLKVKAGATFKTGLRSTIEVFFMSEGRIAVGGKEYGPRTAIELAPGDPSEDIVAKEDALFFVTTFPKF